MHAWRQSPWSWLVSGAAALLLMLGAYPSALASTTGSAPAADRATLTLVDSAYGDALNPLLLQVVGLGFRPGERVRITAAIRPAGGRAITLAPMTAIADRDGNVAAVLVGPGLGRPADGFIVRAVGDQHRASVVDLVSGGASLTTPAPRGTVSDIG